MIHYIVCNSLNRVPFGKCKQVRVPTSFICTEWHFINSFRSSSKCFFVTSLSTDSCTKRKTSSLPHFLLLCFRVCIEATIKVSKPLAFTIWETSSIAFTIWETSSKLGISTISGILSQLCCTIFTITITSGGVCLFSLIKLTEFLIVRI